MARASHYLYGPAANLIFEGEAVKRGDANSATLLRSPHLDQAIIHQASTLLANEGGQLVRRCGHCSRVFQATRNKLIFCGRTCANAANFNRYKETLGEEAYKAKHSQSARASWRKKRGRKALKEGRLAP